MSLFKVYCWYICYISFSVCAGWGECLAGEQGMYLWTKLLVWLHHVSTVQLLDVHVNLFVYIDITRLYCVSIFYYYVNLLGGGYYSLLDWLFHFNSKAKECNAVSHCIQSVWEKKVLPEDNDDICTLCKDMVQQARDQLLSNETQVNYFVSRVPSKYLTKIE